MSRKYLTLVFCLAINGCSWISDFMTPAPVINPMRIQLFMSHASLVQTDFELLKVMGSKLFYECGELKYGRPKTNDQGVVSIEDDIFEELMISADKVARLQDRGALQFATSGSSTNLFDPGVFEMTLSRDKKNSKITTSVDAVVNSDDATKGPMLELTERLRGAVGKVLCGKEMFYGSGTIWIKF